MLRRSLAGLVAEEAFRCAGVAADRAGGAARRGRVGQASRMPTVHRERAHAKLTRTLEVTGRRRRRLPPPRVRDGLPRFRRRARDRREGRRPRGPRRDRLGRHPCVEVAPRRRCPAGPENLVARALRLGRPDGEGAPAKADPRRRRARGRVRRTRRRCCAGRGSATRRSPRRLGADVPFCLAGGRAAVGGHRRGPHAAPRRGGDLPALHARPSRSRPRWSTRPSTSSGRPGPGSGRNDLEPAALAVEPRLARWRDLLARSTGRPARARRQRLDLVRRVRSSRGRGARAASCGGPWRGRVPSSTSAGRSAPRRREAVGWSGRPGRGRRRAARATWSGAASACASASSCASSCACACGAS